MSLPDVVQGISRAGGVLRGLGKFLELGTATRCLACGKVIPVLQSRVMCCEQCQAELRLRKKGFCPGCGLIFTSEQEEPYFCLDCRIKSPPWQGFGFFQAYKGLLRELILAYKYEVQLGYNSLLRQLLLQAYELHLAGHIDRDALVVPVPMHAQRLKQRGFNHSLELARGLCNLGLEIGPGALQRLKPTSPQTGLGKSKRWQNLQGAFKAHKQEVRGRQVLLVDDVYTTGATVGLCSRELLRAGARQVQVLVLARAEIG
ncbi:MAG: ComF family protein [Desulfohalobiaceae bacterium]